MTATWHGTATWVVDEVPTASKMNEQIRDHADFFKLLQKDNGDPSFQYASYTTSDFVKNNDNTVADITGLSFPIGVSEIWMFLCIVFGISTTAADWKFGLTFPSGAVGRWGLISQTGGGGSNQQTQLIASTILTNADAVRETIFIGGLVVNSTTAGDVQLQGAQATPTVFNTTIDKYSAIFAAKMT